MKARFVSSSRFSVGCRSVLIVAMAGLISAASPALAQSNVNSAEGTSSQVTVISQEALDNLLAPIALYPDVLLAQVLMAVTYPWEVIEAADWQLDNEHLEGDALQKALEDFDWDPSVKSLVTVPQVLQYMADSQQWMQDLGKAVVHDQPRVMDAVQQLRRKARTAGTLKSNEKQVVEVRVDNTRKVEYITIAPPATQVVYVPVYDTRVVYGDWWWPTRPVYWGPPAGVVFTSGYYWGPRHYSTVALWGGFNWGGSLITINAPIYSNYYRRPPPRMDPYYGWRRPPPPRDYFYRPPPPRHPYSGRPTSRYPVYDRPGRDQRPPAYRRSETADRPGGRQDRSDRSTNMVTPRGNAQDGSRGGGREAGRDAGGRQDRSDRPTNVDRQRGGAQDGARGGGREAGREAGGRQDRSERPSGADRQRGGAQDGARQVGAQQLGSEAPSNAGATPRGAQGGDARQTGGRQDRSERPSGADQPRGNVQRESRQAGGQQQQNRTERPLSADQPRGQGGDVRQAGGQQRAQGGDVRQAGERQGRTERPSNAGAQQRAQGVETRQAGGQQNRSERPSNAGAQQRAQGGDARQAGGQQNRSAAPPNAGVQPRAQGGEPRQAGGQRSGGGEPRQASGSRGGGGDESRQAGGSRGGGGESRQGGGGRGDNQGGGGGRGERGQGR